MSVALVAVLAGIAIMAASTILTRRAQEREIDLLLDLRPVATGGREAATREAGGGHAVAEGVVRLTGDLVSRFDPRGSLARGLERARIPLRPGEYVIFTVAGGLVVAALFTTVTGGIMVFGVLGFLLALGVSVFLVRFLTGRRRRAFESQLPGALTLIASSLAAGHTFLRSIQMMCEESDPPLAEEFARVVAETRLGDSVVDALGRMAERLQIRDLDWVVQAIRIQQTVGGRLADLLHTLADFIRARDEVRREVRVLTAEGRMSAWVLGGLAPLLLLAMQVMNPDYAAPLYSGTGLILLGVSATMVVTGTVMIFRMVKIEV